MIRLTKAQFAQLVGQLESIIKHLKRSGIYTCVIPNKRRRRALSKSRSDRSYSRCNYSYMIRLF